MTTARAALPVATPKSRAPAPPPPRKPPPRQAPVVPKVDVEEGRRRAAEEERVRAAEQERVRAEQERVRAAEQERVRVEQERVRAAEQERIRVAEQERTRAEEERGRAEEEKFRAREEALRKQREERSARMRQLEKEEEEQERLEEERYRARVEALKARSSTPKVVEPTSPVKVVKEPVKPQEPVKVTPPAVIPPQASANPATPIEKSTNPFSRLLSQGASAPTTPAVTTPAATTNGNTNPWAAARPQTAPPPSSKSPAYQTVPAANEDDWDIIKEKDESGDDSSDDELAQSRTARANIAQQLFGSMLPRPQSSGPPVSLPSSPAPGVGSGVAPPPPPPPPAPAAMFAPPPAVAAAVTPAAPGDVSALMQSIQGGMKLRPTKTVDKSAPPVSGRVIGDTAPPLHINVNVPPPPTSQPNYPERVSSLPQPTSMMDEAPPKMSNRQSVGWFTTRAADAGVSPVDQLPATVEEEDDDDIYATPPTIPFIQVDEHVSNANEPVSELMADIDKSIEHRARSLYAYEGDGPEDLSFAENLVLIVNPSKSGSDWWFGTTLKDGRSGLFPKTYIEVVQPTKAKAIYAYETNSTDEYSFDEGDELAIVDKSDAEWWKTEHNGVVLIVPAAYLEDVEG